MTKIYDIFAKLKEEILDEQKYKKGDSLPSERELMKIFDASRNTVRTALSMLENDSLIYKIHGKGNFVSGTVIKQNLNSFYSFHENVKAIGKIPSSKVISFELIPANPKLQEIFKLTTNTNVYRIKRLRLIDNKAVMLEETFIPEYRFNNFVAQDLNTMPMYEIFKCKYNVNFEKAIESFIVVNIVDEDDMRYLEYNKDDLAMQITRLTYEHSKVIEYTISHTRNEVFEYTVTLNM